MKMLWVSKAGFTVELLKLDIRALTWSSQALGGPLE